MGREAIRGILSRAKRFFEAASLTTVERQVRLMSFFYGEALSGLIREEFAHLIEPREISQSVRECMEKGAGEKEQNTSIKNPKANLDLYGFHIQERTTDSERWNDQNDGGSPNFRIHLTEAIRCCRQFLSLLP
jgi:predicted RNA binding protein with dsRBD fold (UPF0201 family)